MPTLSIIVPIYNSSEFLNECLDSILEQTFSSFEVICINDGSIDNSLEILKQYREKDSRINIISQRNQGVSAARNAGLAIAQGEFIGFVDSDDTIQPEFYETLIQEMKSTNADVVYSKTSLNQKQDFYGIIERNQVLENVLPQFIKQDNNNAVWSKLFKNSIIKKCEIRFPVGVTHGEDGWFNILYLIKVNSISILNYYGYNYRSLEGSATRNIIENDYLKQIIDNYQKDWHPIIGELITKSKLQQLKRIRLINAIISLTSIYGNIGNDFTQRQRIIKLKEIVNHSDVKKCFKDKSILPHLGLSKYTKAIYHGIQKQNLLKLYILIQYSYYRNKRKG